MPLLGNVFHLRCGRGEKRLKRPRNQSGSFQGPMKKISDLFTDEGKKQLSYFGSMLHQEPTEEEQEQQRILDAMDSQEWAKRAASKDVKPQGEEAEQHGDEV
jgi:hypothetical protein